MNETAETTKITYSEIEHDLPTCCGLKPSVFQTSDKRRLLIIECRNPGCAHDNHVHALLCDPSDYREGWEGHRVKN